MIDVHAHFLTEDYIAAATRAGHHRPEGIPRWVSWSADDHLSRMDRAGVELSVLSLPAPGTHFGDPVAARQLTRAANTAGAQAAHDRPDRFAHLAALPLPDLAGAMRELTYALDILGSHGVALLTNTHGVYLGDRRYEELYAELNRRGTTVFVHPVSPPNWQSLPTAPRPMLEYLFDSARAASNLISQGILTRYPNITWIFSHAGALLPALVDRLEQFRDAEGPSVADQLASLWYDTAAAPLAEAVPALTRAFGKDHVVYGNDHCWPTPDAHTHAKEEWRILTTTNARKLFPAWTQEQRLAA